MTVRKVYPPVPLSNLSIAASLPTVKGSHHNLNLNKISQNEKQNMIEKVQEVEMSIIPVKNAPPRVTCSRSPLELKPR